MSQPEQQSESAFCIQPHPIFPDPELEDEGIVPLPADNAKPRKQLNFRVKGLKTNKTDPVRYERLLQHVEKRERVHLNSLQDIEQNKIRNLQFYKNL